MRWTDSPSTKTNKLKLTLGLLLTLLLFLTSCRSYYNDTIDWVDSIEPGTVIDNVKKSQPDFVDIDWNKPDTVDNQVKFEIVKIKGNRDVLAMTHYLVFIDNKFEGREIHK
jgi:hypothetical protein